MLREENAPSRHHMAKRIRLIEGSLKIIEGPEIRRQEDMDFQIKSGNSGKAAEDKD